MSPRGRAHAALFLFSGTAPPAVYTLSLHDALPIWLPDAAIAGRDQKAIGRFEFLHLAGVAGHAQDRKSTRLNSSHRCTSYAVFCLKKKTYVVSLLPGAKPPCNTVVACWSLESPRMR